MNRETKRMMAKQGNDPSQAKQRRAVAQQPMKEKRTSPAQYLKESMAELKLVAWPTKAEAINSSTIVLIGIVFMSFLIFGFDLAASKFVLYLFD